MWAFPRFLPRRLFEFWDLLKQRSTVLNNRQFDTSGLKSTCECRDVLRLFHQSPRPRMVRDYCLHTRRIYIGKQLLDIQYLKYCTSDINSWKFRRPIKQIPVLSGRFATWFRPFSSAILRTSVLNNFPMGKRVLLNGSCLMWLRKNVWSLKVSFAMISFTPKKQTRC